MLAPADCARLTLSWTPGRVFVDFIPIREFYARLIEFPVALLLAVVGLIYYAQAISRKRGRSVQPFAARMAASAQGTALVASRWDKSRHDMARDMDSGGTPGLRLARLPFPLRLLGKHWTCGRLRRSIGGSFTRSHSGGIAS